MHVVWQRDRDTKAEIRAQKQQRTKWCLAPRQQAEAANGRGLVKPDDFSWGPIKQLQSHVENLKSDQQNAERVTGRCCQ